MENRKTTFEELYALAELLFPYAFIAGGFYKDMVRGIEPKDIDVFCTSRVELDIAKSILEAHEKAEAVDRNVSLSIGRFELIKPKMIRGRKLYGWPEELVASFDIAIAQVYIDPFKGIVMLEDDIDEQIENGVTDIFVLSGDEKRTQERLLRYEKYGFSLREEKRQLHKLSDSSMAGGY